MSFYPAVRQKSFGDLDALRSTARPPTSPAIAALMRPTKSSMMALYISDRSYTGQRWPLRDEMWIQTVKQERRALSKMPPGCTLKSKDYIKAPEPTPQQRASPAAIASASAPRAHWQRERMFDSRGQRSSGAGFNNWYQPAADRPRHIRTPQARQYTRSSEMAANSLPRPATSSSVQLDRTQIQWPQGDRPAGHRPASSQSSGSARMPRRSLSTQERMYRSRRVLY